MEPSGETPRHVKDDPFEIAVMESINVSLVPLHMPRLTDPIALCMGFSMQAEVIKHASKFAEFQKAQRKAFPGRESKWEEPGGGLFFASRTLGRSPAVQYVRPHFLVRFCLYVTGIECFERGVFF